MSSRAELHPSASTAGPVTSPVRGEAHAWLHRAGRESWLATTRVPLEEVEGWRTGPAVEFMHHESGRFFRVSGLDVTVEGWHESAWTQPVIEQPDVGILALVARRGARGVEVLAQAKPEPGNPTGIQVAPSVQATRSNYLGAHGGRAVPLLDVVREAAPHDRVVDVRQSEHGSVFLRKRNRNMVVVADPELPSGTVFRWCGVRELYRLFAADDRINMDTRTVLSCLPWTWVPTDPSDHDPVVAAIARSADPASGSLHPTPEVRHWITRARSETAVRTRTVPLVDLPGWHRVGGELRHERGDWFDVIGVQVEGRGREVARWGQPMLRPRGAGVLGLLVARFSGVLHVLVKLRTEPGLVDAVEIAPTVQHRPGDSADLADPDRDSHLNEVRHAAPHRVVYDGSHSDEGGRFFSSYHRHLIVEVDPDREREDRETRWLTLHQLADLLLHSHYVNLQLRSLLSCLQAVSATGRHAEAPAA